MYTITILVSGKPTYLNIYPLSETIRSIKDFSVLLTNSVITSDNICKFSTPIFNLPILLHSSGLSTLFCTIFIRSYYEFYTLLESYNLKNYEFAYCYTIKHNYAILI